MGGGAQIIWGLIFGVIGLAYFTYGRKQRAIVPLVAGISLFVVPYFISNSYILVAVGTVILIVPYFVRI